MPVGVQAQPKMATKFVSRPMQPPPLPPSRSQFHAPQNKLGPPVPVKPDHLLRNPFTPPPHTGNSSKVLGLSSSSLPDAEFSGLDHPQLSSTLKLLQPFPVQNQELVLPPKPPKPPIRKDSMKKSLEEGPHLSRKQETVTSLEESFFTRFKPISILPNPPPFTNCHKTYPSMDAATLPKKHGCSKSTAPIPFPRAECVSIKAEVSPNDCFAWDTSPPKQKAPIQKPSTEPPSPPLTANGPQFSSTSKLVPLIYKTSVSMAIPPPPSLPVEQTRNPAYSVSSNSAPPPLIPPPITHNSPVQPSSSVHQANPLCTSGSSSTQEFPVSVQILASSVFAENLAKLYSSGQMERKKDQNAFSTNLKPLSPPKPGIKPALGRRPQLHSVEETHSQPVVLQSKSESPLTNLLRSSSSASLVSFNYSSLEVSRTRSSSSLDPIVIKQSSISRKAPPPPKFKTFSVSITSSGLNHPEFLKVVRSQSMRTAPPPPRHAPTSCSTQQLDRRLSLRSSTPLKTSESNMKTDAVPNEPLSDSYSFRSAPPPPPPPPSMAPAAS